MILTRPHWVNEWLPDTSSDTKAMAQAKRKDDSVSNDICNRCVFNWNSTKSYPKAYRVLLIARTNNPFDLSQTPADEQTAIYHPSYRPCLPCIAVCCYSIISSNLLVTSSRTVICCLFASHQSSWSSTSKTIRKANRMPFDSSFRSEKTDETRDKTSMSHNASR